MDVVVPVLTLLSGVVLGYVGSLFTFHFDVARSTRSARMEAYRVLWSKSALLPLSPRNHDVTYAALDKLRGDLKDWYFHDGGLFLSRPARDRYLAIQATLTSFFEPPRRDACDPRSEEPDDGTWKRAFDAVEDKVDPRDYDRVRCELSRLRSLLADDLSSRARAPLKAFLSRLGLRD